MGLDTLDILEEKIRELIKVLIKMRSENAQLKRELLEKETAVNGLNNTQKEMIRTKVEDMLRIIEQL